MLADVRVQFGSVCSFDVLCHRMRLFAALAALLFGQLEWTGHICMGIAQPATHRSSSRAHALVHTNASQLSRAGPTLVYFLGDHDAGAATETRGMRAHVRPVA